MPVLVVGAASPLGRQVCRALVATGGQVRAYIAEDDAALRATGVHVAVGGRLDVPRLESALTQVHTLLHLTGRDVRRRSDEAEALEVSAIAAHAASVPRVVVLIREGAVRKNDRSVQKGLHHFDGRDPELVLVCVQETTDDEIVRALLAADARA